MIIDVTLRFVHPFSQHFQLSVSPILACLILLLFAGCATKHATTLDSMPYSSLITIEVVNSAPLFMESPQPGDPYTDAAVTEPIISEATMFLAGLKQDEIEQLKAEAQHLTSKHWENINARSQQFYHRMESVAQAMDAPKYLLFIPVAESGYNPYALSHVGASGLWQLMPRTARMLGAMHKNGIDERRHVEESTRAALTYLLRLHERFDSWTLAICAYNLGPSGVERRLKKSPWTPDQGLNELPFPAETRNYIKLILGMIALADAGEIEFSNALKTQPININAPIDLNKLEAIAGLEKGDIFYFNPEFDYQHYLHQNINVSLPEENVISLHQALSKNPDIFKPKFIQIKIKPGDSLSVIAYRYRTTTQHLRALNPLQGKTLRIGKSLTVPAADNMYSGISKTNPLLSKGRRIYYKVKNGDSLWTIAKKFGTSTQAIARINQMPEHNLIRPGDKLWIIASLQSAL